MPRSRTDQPIEVLHFGNDAGSVRGGIAAVIRQHLQNPEARLAVSATPTYDPSADTHWRRNAPYLRALVRAAAPRQGGDLVAHVHISRGGSLLREGFLVMLLRLRRIPVVATLHGSSSLTSRGVPFLLTGLVLRCADLAHFLSEAHRVRYARLAGRHATIPNAVDVDPTPATGKQQDVVFAGVVGTRKGVDLLLEAWQSIPSAGWCLHLYGPSDSGFAVPGGLPRVVVHGEVSPAVVQKALAAASIAVLPSREEAFPMFLLEAMAQRCAIVASDVGGVRELMGSAGVLVPADDAQALGAALVRVLGEPGLQEELAAAAWQRARERFDSAVIARTWADAYASLVGRPQSSGEGSG